MALCSCGGACDFYPRSPCGERLPNFRRYIGSNMPFLSTLSLRRATNGHEKAPYRAVISIHALLAESDTWARGSRVTYVISIHALLAESDPPRVVRQPATTRFLSTLSLRRATVTVLGIQHRVGDFYPRSPCGERPNPKIRLSLTIMISIHALLAESDL